MSDQKINEIFSQVHNDAAIAEPITAEADRESETAEAVNPYCHELVDGRPCIGTADHDFDHVPLPLSQSEKIDYMFDRFQELEKLVEQAGPLLEQAGPLLASFAGPASSPLGRIAGSLFR